MEKNLSLDGLKTQHARLDNAIREEESYVWKNLMKIEELKKEKLKKKDQMLRMCLHSFKQ